MTPLEKLLSMVKQLEQNHETVRLQLEKEMPDIDPYDVRDTNGRYILLDSLTALVQATSTLVLLGPRDTRQHLSYRMTRPPWQVPARPSSDRVDGSTEYDQAPK